MDRRGRDCENVHAMNTSKLHLTGARPGRYWVLCAGLIVLGVLAGCATPPPAPPAPPLALEGPAVEQDDLGTGDAAARAKPSVPTNQTAYVDPAKVADDASAYPQIELLTEALLDVRKFYVDEKTYKEITLGAIHGMLQSLDPHSSFMEAEEYTEMQDDTSGKFSGIGVHIGVQDGMLTVISPIEDTPGFRAGLQAGDRILEIDGFKTADMTLREAVKHMRGDKGTKVTISVQGVEDPEPRTIEIVRDDIMVPSVKGAAILRDGIGYIRITQFAKPTAEALQVGLNKLQAEGMSALVLDLRNNPGGLLNSAVEVAEKFLKKGEVIVTTRGRPKVQDEIVAKAGGDVHLTKFPMVVLINNGSASASEIVAGALKDHRRAVLLGSRSFGKGSVQSVIPLMADESMAVRLTVAYYYTPSGALIHGIGIPPDIEVQLSPEAWRRVLIRRAAEENPEAFTAEQKREHADAVDVQLERALDLLQAIKIFP